MNLDVDKMDLKPEHMDDKVYPVIDQVILR